MKIINKNRGTIIADSCMEANTFARRFLGLMGKKTLPEGSGLIIKPCNSIHMFFMRIPLDVIFIDKSNKVIYTIEDFKPWRVSKIVRGAVCTIELPIGALKRSRTSIGDMLELV